MPDAYLSFPALDPVAFSMGPFAVRWYALAYLVGVVFTWGYARWILTRHGASFGISPKIFDDILSWSIVGIIVGGRLGYVLFYDLDYFIEHPSHIPMTWKGGMSFHGGLLGVLAVFFIFAKIHKIPFLRILDVCALGAPMGIFFGRLANFVNGELYGRVTDVPWAILFPKGGYLPRHPSQLYEAGLEGLLIFVVLNICFWRTRFANEPGRIAGLGLVLYALARFFVEFFREPDAHLGFVWGVLSMGQLLSVPYALLGSYLIMRKVR